MSWHGDTFRISGFCKRIHHSPMDAPHKAARNAELWYLFAAVHMNKLFHKKLVCNWSEMPRCPSDLTWQQLSVLVHYWHHMVIQIWVNIGSGNGSLPDSSKPLPEPMLTYQWCPVAFISRVISEWMPKPLFCIMSLKIIILNYCHISQGPMS